MKISIDNQALFLYPWNVKKKNFKLKNRPVNHVEKEKI